jgi:hypothetical protein
MTLPSAEKPFDLMAKGGFRELLEKARRRLEAGVLRAATLVWLRRDLLTPFKAPAAKIPIAVRKVTDGDIPFLFPDPNADLPAPERKELAWRRQMLKAGTPTCFVAVDQRNGTPCYVQWLLGAAQNATIEKLGCFPALTPDEALLENAYTPVNYRGMGIMPAAMALIAERAAEFNARYVLTFVGVDNIASLKGCERAGFAPYLVRRQQQYCYNLIRRLAFEDLPASVRRQRGMRPLSP